MILDITQAKYRPDLEISYIDSNSRRQILTVPKNEIHYWKYTMNGGDSEYKSWDEKNVQKFYYADDDYVDKIAIWEWINNTEDKIKKDLFGFNLPNILFCDIETDVIDGFPEPAYAKEKITAITVCYVDRNNRIQVIILGEKVSFDDKKHTEMNDFIRKYFKDVTDMEIILRYNHIPDEKQLLTTFCKICAKFDVLTGWNFINTFTSTFMNDKGFDWPFLSKRMDNLGVDYSIISPVGRIRNDKKIGKVPEHFFIMDYMYYFDKFDRSIKVKVDKSLDFVSGEVLKVKKLKYKNHPTMNGEVLVEMYNEDYDKYVLYNAVDTVLVLLIHQYRQTFTAILGQGNDSTNQMSKADSAVNVTEGYMVQYFLERKRVLPLIDLSSRKKEKYEGAYVKSPVAGMHFFNACFDFSSLYPSISRFLFLSFENYIGKHLDKNFKTYDDFKEHQEELNRNNSDEVIALNGCKFKKEINGLPPVLKTVYDDLYKARKTNQYRSKLCAKLAHELSSN